MVQKHRNLVLICNNKKLNPLLNAAIHVSVENSEIIRFLCDVMKDEKSSSFRGHLGAHLICSITRAELCELALYILREHPCLATAQELDGNTMLNILADKGSRIARTPVSTDGKESKITDKLSTSQKVVFFLFPGLKARYDERMRSYSIYQELLDISFREISCMTKKDMYRFFSGTNLLKAAAISGATEIVKRCISTFPDQLWFPHEGRNIFQIAVENRRGSTFDYLYGHMNADEKILCTRTRESNGGNILHVAAKIASPSRLNVLTSPVAQMKNEIKWFKKVEERVPPALGNMRNDQGETPQEVFTREHKDLARKAEAYIIRTAESCLIVAALVATVSFAAIITVPGGNWSDNHATNKGKPIFLENKSFLAFVLLDALALLCSTVSILLFLSIYAGSYAEANFVKILPKTMKIGLGSLVLSVLAVVTVFFTAIDIMFEGRYAWVRNLIGLLVGGILCSSSFSLLYLCAGIEEIETRSLM